MRFKEGDKVLCNYHGRIRVGIVENSTPGTSWSEDMYSIRNVNNNSIGLIYKDSELEPATDIGQLLYED